MELQIKQNDAFLQLAKITGTAPEELSKQILKGLDKLGFFVDWTQEAGKTIGTIHREFNDFHFEEIVDSIWPNDPTNKNIEKINFLDGVLLWGTAMEHGCEKCGCECDVEHDGTDGISWKNVNCTNPECDWSDSREPDWDGLPGGYDSKY